MTWQELDKKDRDYIAEKLIGSCDYGDNLADEFDLEIDEIEDMMVTEYNQEICPNCGWWDECGNMIDEELEVDGFCSNCREEKEEG